MVAHVLAHELFWDEYRLAWEGRQDDKVQEIDLCCDGMSTFSLARRVLEPIQLTLLPPLTLLS